MEKVYKKIKKFKEDVYFKDKATVNSANFSHFIFTPINNTFCVGRDVLVLDGGRLKIKILSEEDLIGDTIKTVLTYADIKE